MSDDTSQDISGKEGTGPKTAPHSWGGVFMGVTTVAIAAIAGVVLLSTYLNTRPMNLCPHTEHLIGYAEELLRANHVPESNVTRGPAEKHEDAMATWLSYRVDVTLPPTLTAKGLERLVTRDLTENGVTVVRSVDDSGMSSDLSLSVDGRGFAVLHLTGGAGRVDLTEQCRAIAQEVRDTLKNSDLVAHVGASATEAKKDKIGKWCLSRMEVELADGAATLDVAAAIRQHVRRDKTHVRGPSDLEGSMIRVVHRDKTCVEIRFVVPQPMVPGEVQLPLVNLPWPSEAATGGDNAAGKEPEQTPPLSSTQSSSLKPGAKKPRVAIILDDGGHGGPATDAVLALDTALTLAILPGAVHTADTARRAKEKGFELMLHVPMESNSKSETYPDWLTTTMDSKHMAKTFESALAQVPGAVGVNNHIGSKFTEDEAAMRIFIALLKEHSLYFIDSRTTAKSKAYDIAKAMKNPCGVRNVFLDHERTEIFIQKQFKALIKTAREQGRAIGICHFDPTTASQLAKLLPGLKTQGIELVPASELVQ